MSSGGKNFLSGIEAVILEQGLGKARAEILAKQLKNHGGTAVRTAAESTTHILVGNNIRLARVPVLLKVDSVPESVSILRGDWLSKCLVKGEVVPEDDFRVLPEAPNPAALSPVKQHQGTSASTSPTKGSVDTSQKPSTSTGVAHSDRQDSIAVTEEAMLNPKAGMFAVTGRHWKSSPVKAKPVPVQPDSDSDYVPSDDGDDDADTDKADGAEECSEASKPPKKVHIAS